MKFLKYIDSFLDIEYLGYEPIVYTIYVNVVLTQALIDLFLIKTIFYVIILIRSLTT